MMLVILLALMQGCQKDCTRKQKGYLKTRVTCYGFTRILFYDENSNLLETSLSLSYYPNSGVDHEIEIIELPSQCYKLTAINWLASQSVPPDTVFYIYPCIEQCKTTEIVLQRL
jgi:hypothetical protein